MAKPHVILIPLPAQGHVIPVMELAQCLVKENIKVTLVNTDEAHNMMKENWLEKFGSEDLVELVSFPDGLEPWEDRNEVAKLRKSMYKYFPSKLEELIETINKKDNNKVACVIVDTWMSWTLHVAKKMQVRGATFFTASTATLATMMSIQKLIDDGFISNVNGSPLKSEMIRLSETMPPIKPENLVWAGILDSSDIEDHFQFNVRSVKDATMTEWNLCNSAIEVEPAAFNLFPQLLPVGPLLVSDRLTHKVGRSRQEDSTCMAWLDQQPVNSVLYVAFGTIAKLTDTQIEELALGLELSNRPFLWVIRPSTTKETSTTYLDGFMNRVGSRGKIVTWAPQENVLAHPSIACFMSHCGWNSTLEGVTNGIPFLCWPCFADQYYNETYICDIWKTGLRFNKDETNIVTKEEIKSKVDHLLTNTTFKSNALNIKDDVTRSVTKGGVSHENLTKFISWIYDVDKNNKVHSHSM